MKKIHYISLLVLNVSFGRALEAHWFEKTARLTTATLTSSFANALHQKFWQKQKPLNKIRIATNGITAGALTSVFSSTIANKIQSPLLRNISSIAFGIGASNLLSEHTTLPSWIPGAQKWNNLNKNNKPLITTSIVATAALCLQAYRYYQKKKQHKNTKEKTPINKEKELSENKPTIEERINQGEKIIDDFSQWKQYVDNVNMKSTKYIKYDDFKNLLDATQAQYEKEYQPYMKKTVSLGAIAKKITLPQDSQIAVHADIHGDAQAICSFIQDLNGKKYMNGWKITKDNFYIVLLGDYTDRGSQDIESFMSVLKLKTSNPDNVILIRGNHESKEINELYGFWKSLLNTFFQGKKSYKYYNNIELIGNFYEYLPDAVFIGQKDTANKKTNWMLFCHGGINTNHDVKTFLQSKNTYDKFANDSFEGFDQLQYERPNYQWTDFHVDDNNKENKTPEQSQRGWKYTKETTEKYLQNNNISAVIRGHQHGDFYKEMGKKGIVRHWPKSTKKEDANKITNSLVYTLSIAPKAYKRFETYFKNFTCAYGLITTKNTVDKWTLDVTMVKEKEKKE